MKTQIKNLLAVFRRFRLSTTLNVLGLSMAFTIFMVIMMQVYYDHTYNTGVKDYERMFIPYAVTDDQNYVFMSPPVMDELGALPHVESYTFCQPYKDEMLFLIGEQYVSGTWMPVAPNFAEVAGLDVIAGTPDCLHVSGQLLVPESFAVKYFGTADAAGKTLRANGQTLIVGGVYKDLAKNNVISDEVFVGIEKKWYGENWNNRYMNSFMLLVKLDSPESAAAFKAAANKTLADMKAAGTPDRFKDGYGLVPLQDAHYEQHVKGLPDVPIKSTTEMILVTIAFAIVLIASINYVNFSNSLIPMRIRSVNVRKILGATRLSLGVQLLVESVVVTLFSFLLSVGIVEVLSHTSFSRQTDAGLSPGGYLPVVVLTLGVAVAVGLVSGIFPAFRMTSYSPAVVLKGNFGLSPKGQLLRGAMIGFQFFASAVLIIGASLMQKQRDFMVDSEDYGFKKDELIVCNLNHGELPSDLEQVVESVRKLPFVAGAALSWSTLGEDDNTQGWVFNTPSGEDVSPRTLFAKSGYFTTMGIPIVEGRDFNATDSCAVIVNRQTREAYKEVVDIGRQLTFGRKSFTVVGICDDAKFSSLHSATGPVMAVCMPYDCRILNIRVKKGTNMFDSMEGIRRCLAGYDASYPFEIRHYDQILDATYQKEIRLTKQITIFSLLAVFISIVGVFGLVMFDSEYRRREIAVRKVFGSSTASVIGMFNKKYLAILAVGFAAAVPAATFAVSLWLENFAYKTVLSWWVYALAFLALAAVTVATVSYQCRRAAKANPIESLKYE